MGRAPGADMSTAVALATDGRPKFERFPELVAGLSDYLWNEHSNPLVSPRAPGAHTLWMLGSSPDSAVLAAQRACLTTWDCSSTPGRPAPDRPLQVTLPAQRHAGPAPCHPHPSVYSAPIRREQAQGFAIDLRFEPVPVFRSIQWRILTPSRRWPTQWARGTGVYRQPPDSRAAGTPPQQVREQIAALAELHGADEIMAVTNMYYFEDRKALFQVTDGVKFSR